MSKLEINLSLNDIDGDKLPEVLISFVEYKDRVATITHSSAVTSSGKNGVYDRVTAGADVDGDGVYKDDEDDNQALIELAQAFAKFAKVAKGA